MKTVRRGIALLLALVMIFSLSSTAFAAESTKTAALLKQVAASGKFCMTSSGITHNGISYGVGFQLYDDLKGEKLCCTLTQNGIKIISTGSEITVVIPRIFCYLTLSAENSAVASTALKAFNEFQKIFADFCADPDLTAFDVTVSAEQHNGKMCTKETFHGRVIGTEGVFYYDESGSLTDMILYDNAGEYVQVAVNSFAVDFEDSAFDKPAFCFDLSFLWKLIFYFVQIFTGISAAA